MKEKMFKRDKMIITNIQRMCMHDGPGIRTTVFMKGCNLHCPWCANPENISGRIQAYTSEDGIEKVYGREYDAAQLYKEIMKDSAYWKRGGGVTFSGGEPLLQAEALVELLKRLKDVGGHVAFETALMTDKDLVEVCIPYVDLFIVDMKILLPDLCGKVLGGNVDRFFRNLEILSAQNKEILFRIPCNREYTLRDGNIEAIVDVLKRYPEHPIEIFATHSLAKKKYECLGRKYIDFEPVTESELELLAQRIRGYVSSVTINRI